MEVRTKLLAALCIAGLSMPAFAETYTDDNGNRMECHYESAKGGDGHPVASPLAGAVVGGVVGHQFGGGKGNDLATVAGAGAGAYAGKKYNDNKVDKANDDGETRKVCRQIN